MNSKQTGTLNELVLATECTRRGAIVSIPVGDFCPYDLVVDSGRLCRVQVKTASFIPATGQWMAATRRSAMVDGKRHLTPYDVTEIDVMAIIADGVWFFIPWQSEFPMGIAVYPARDRDGGKWNLGKEDWEALGLESRSALPMAERADFGGFFGLASCTETFGGSGNIRKTS